VQLVVLGFQANPHPIFIATCIGGILQNFCSVNILSRAVNCVPVWADELITACSGDLDHHIPSSIDASVDRWVVSPAIFSIPGHSAPQNLVVTKCCGTCSEVNALTILFIVVVRSSLPALCQALRSSSIPPDPQNRYAELFLGAVPAH
jgi:hypothetical protein